MTVTSKATAPSSAADMQVLIEQLIGALLARRREAESSLVSELQSISAYIQGVKADLSSIGPELKTRYIPTATDELDAITETTAEATNRIMDAAESIDAVVKAGAWAGAEKEALSAAATQIYEACTFQDLTGQRVTKVATALREIELKIDAMIATFSARLGITDGHAVAEPAPASAPAEDDGVVRAHGPQLPSIAKSQDEIDALMEGLG